MANIKKDLETLIELQKRDIAQEVLRKEVDKKNEKVAANQDALHELEDKLLDEREEIDKKRHVLTSLENELAETIKGLEHAIEKKNKVGNSRDFATIEQEENNFTKLQAQIESDIEKTKEALKNAEEAIVVTEKDVETLRGETDGLVADAEAAEAAIEDQVNTLKAEVEKLSKEISSEVLKRYQFIRKRRAGEALVSASNGTCLGCHMKLQPQTYIRLQRGATLECCQNCQRILYFSAEEHASMNNK